MRKSFFMVLSSWFLTRSDTNQAVQPQKMARGLQFQIKKVEATIYVEASIYVAKNRFSHDTAQITLSLESIETGHAKF